jgi:hypothetical protein
LNRRRHLSDSEKRWVWSKKIRVLQEEGSGSDNPTASATIVTSALSDTATDPFEELDGCPRNVADCEYCEGNS